MVDVSRNARDMVLCGLIAVATFAVYSGVRHHDFVIYDDNVYVYANEHVRQGLTWEGVVWALTSVDHANWHPVTWLSHMLDCSLFGVQDGAAGGHHLMNVAIHVVNAILTFLLIRGMSGSCWLAGFVAAVFALHPVHVESVAWIAERKDVLSTCFWLLCMLAYLEYAREIRGQTLFPIFRPGQHDNAKSKELRPISGTPKDRVRKPETGSDPWCSCSWCSWYWVSFGCLALGLMSKPMLVTAPFVLLLLDYWPLRRIRLPFPMGHTAESEPNERPWNELLIEKLPMFLVVVLSCGITYYAQQQGGAVTPVLLQHRLSNVVVAYVRYVGKTFWPAELAVLYPHRAGMWQTHHVIGAVAVLLAVTVSVWLLRRQRYLTVGWLWFLGTLVPVIGVVHVGRHSLADRYMYMPMSGLLVMLSWGVRELIGRWPHFKLPVAVLVCAAIVACCYLTPRQVSHWPDSETLFSHALEVTRDNSVIHTNLGKVLQDAGRLDDAIGHFSKAIQINPGEIESRNNLGVALHASERYAESVASFQQALDIQPDNPVVLKNLGLVLVADGQLEAAIECFRKSLAIDRDKSDVHGHLGAALRANGQHDAAVHHFRQAAQLRPDDAGYHNMLGASLHQTGQLPGALAAYQRAVELAPEREDARINLSEALAETGQVPAGIALIRQARAVTPESVPLLKQLGRLHRRQNNLVEATAAYRHVVELDIRDADSHNQLGNILAAQSKIDDAAGHYRAAIRLQPELSPPRYNLALMLQRAGRVREAIELYREVLKLDANLPEVHNNLGVGLEKLGETDEALKHYRRAIELDPNHQKARQNVRRLESQPGR